MDYYIFKKICQGTLYEFYSYRVVFCAPIPTGPRTPDFGSCSMSYSLKLHGEGIRGSQALSVTLQGSAPDESFLYIPSRHVEHVWVKIPQFHRRLVVWAGATKPSAHN